MVILASFGCFGFFTNYSCNFVWDFFDINFQSKHYFKMKNKFTLPFVVMALMFTVFLILANLMEVKVVKVGCLTATAGLAVFPVSYILNDCIVEIYGFAKARFVIWMGFFLNLIFVCFLQVCVALPSEPSWTGQEAVEMVFGNTPRILLGSFLAFIVGSMVNAYVMSVMRRHDGERRFSLRAILSTVFGESADSLIFFPIAFAGNLPVMTIVSLIWTQVVLKTAYEIVVLPVTVRVVRKLRKVEGVENYSEEPDYNWWKMFKI